MNMDLKTTKSISTFVDDFWAYQYDIQVGMFGLIMNSVINKIPSFCIMACEKEEPYATKIFEISAETMHASMMKVSSLLFSLQGCVADDIWPYGTEVDGTI